MEGREKFPLVRNALMKPTGICFPIYHIRLERIFQDTKTLMARREKFSSANNALNKSIEADERGAYCIGVRKRLEYKTVSWQEETAGQVFLYECIPGTPQAAGVIPLALKHTASLSRPP